MRDNVRAFIEGLAGLDGFQQADFVGMDLTRDERRLLLERATGLNIRFDREARGMGL